ncbi:alpha/beta hydrolase [Dyella sp.]|uniref:alpha/beta hydrolase n=1 Tax=Dyella sp. TaxID=1869338 RepID=UPI002ED2E6AD
MKLCVVVLGLLLACGAASVQASVWQPSAGHTQIPLWPGKAPNLQAVPGPERADTNPTSLIGGKTVTAIRNVSQPTMTVYSPAGRNTGAAVVVFPGGGFEILAIDLEGTEVCDWLTAKGVTCIVVKYRVPGAPYDWHCDCRPRNLKPSVPSLQDAQRALRLVRSRARQWHVDPHKIGVLGFSAGGFLVAETSTLYKHRFYEPVDEADKESARPDFALAIYPGHLATDSNTMNGDIPVTGDTPPTFILQAEDDHVDGVHQAQVYYEALKKADVPTEMHLYAHGGHAFGLRPTSNPITHWPSLAETWLGTIGMIPTDGE